MNDSKKRNVDKQFDISASSNWRSMYSNVMRDWSYSQIVSLICGISFVSILLGLGYGANLMRADMLIFEVKLWAWGEFNIGSIPSEAYVASRLFYDHSTVKNTEPASMSPYLDTSNFQNIQSGDIVYVVTDALYSFKRRILPYIQPNVTFNLIVGDSDTTVTPEEVDFIDNEHVNHIFAQNCVVDHPKMTRIPIGLDSHTLQHIISPQKQNDHLAFISRNASSIENRRPLIYVNVDFTTNVFRKHQMNMMPKELLFIQTKRLSKVDYDIEMSTFRYVFSPSGNGYDCHRTWEALILGCIPIVQRSGISPLFQDLPVIEVDEWSQVTAERLRQFEEEFAQTTYNWEKLKFAYWWNQIKQ